MGLAGRIGLCVLCMGLIVWAGRLDGHAQQAPQPAADVSLAPESSPRPILRRTRQQARAEPGVGPVTKLPMPRYVSLGSGKVNVRRGPGREYRRDWVYGRSGLPVRVVDEYEHWRRIEDSDGAGGWVYHALISGRRTVLVTTDGVLLRSEPAGETEAADAESVDCAALRALPPGTVACAASGVVATLRSCRPGWCRIEAGGHRGWVPTWALWGVDPDEVVND